MRSLHIYDPRERALVRAADLMLAPAGMLGRAVRPSPAGAPRRILCLRLERIGDLLMTLPALAELRALAPSAEIDLVVGTWNRELASAIPGIAAVETMDAAWLSREGEGEGLARLLRRARAWRTRRYDVAFNFESDIRTNLLLAASGAGRRVGFASGGGGPLLDVAIDVDRRSHNADNAVALVRAAFGAAAPPAQVALTLPPDAQQRADALIAPLEGARRIGVHVSGGRAVKQWPEERFAEIARRLIVERDAAIVLTGAAADRAQVDRVKAGLPGGRVLDVSGGHDLLTVAGVLRRLDLFVTGDTGPMHLAHAVGTPIVAVFGPSDPVRYAPRGMRDRVVRVELPCSPCNRIRLPPARCTGHTPDCLALIDVARVWSAITDALRDGTVRSPRSAETTRG